MTTVEKFSLAASSIAKRFGIDVHYFVRGSVLTLATHAILTVQSIIIGYAMLRFLPKETLGIYRFAGYVAGTASIFCLPRLTAALSKFIAQEGGKAPVRHTLRISMYICLLGSLGIAVCSPLLQLIDRSEATNTVLVAALLFMPSTLISVALRGFVVGTGEFGIQLRRSVLSILLLVPLALLTIFYLPLPTLLYFVMLTVPILIDSPVIFTYLKRFTNKNRSNRILKNAIHLTFSSLPLLLARKIDSFLVGIFLGFEELAVLVAATFIADQGIDAIKKLLTVSFPRQAKGKDSPERRKKIHTVVLVSTLLLAILVLCSIPILPPIIALLLPNYYSANFISYLYIALLILIIQPTALYHQFFETRGLIKEIYVVKFTTSIIFCLALIVLIPLYGILGALIARAIYRYTFGILFWITMLKAPIQKTA